MLSLGREPQERPSILLRSPEGAADSGCSVRCSLQMPLVCRRFAAGHQPDDAGPAVGDAADDGRTGEAAHQIVGVLGRHRGQQPARSLGVEAQIDSQLVRALVDLEHRRDARSVLPCAGWDEARRRRFEGPWKQG